MIKWLIFFSWATWVACIWLVVVIIIVIAMKRFAVVIFVNSKALVISVMTMWSIMKVWMLTFNRFVYKDIQVTITVSLLIFIICNRIIINITLFIEVLNRFIIIIKWFILVMNLFMKIVSCLNMIMKQCITIIKRFVINVIWIIIFINAFISVINRLNISSTHSSLFWTWSNVLTLSPSSAARRLVIPDSKVVQDTGL